MVLTGYKKIYENSRLSQAAYANFRDIFDEETIIQDLRSQDEGDFTVTQANNITSDYAILHHLPNTASGFSATVFQNRETGEITLAKRGTISFRVEQDVI